MDEQEKVNYEERDRLLYELVVRQSALEKVLLKFGIITEKDLAEAQVECMEKLKSIMDQHQKDSTTTTNGFIKYGENEDHDWSHESRKKE